MKVCFICSTSGSVIRRAYEMGLFDDFEITIVTDRDCGVVEFCKEYGIVCLNIPSESGKDFSQKFVDQISLDDFDVYVSFFTRIFIGEMVASLKGRLINFHPSILPACPGKKGFHDTLDSGAMFYGSTVHFIDDGIDTGRPVLQASAPNNVNLTRDERRHRVFLQQVIALGQVLHWYSQGRVTYSVDVDCEVVLGARYECEEFSPNLDPYYMSRYHGLVNSELS